MLDEFILEDVRCRESFAEVISNLGYNDEDWRYVVTPHFATSDYIVSNCGKLVSLPRYRIYAGNGRSRVVHRKFLPGRLLKPAEHKSGHFTVTLSHDRKPFKTYLHQLVAWTFVGKMPPASKLIHVDGDPSNNRALNLCYINTQSNGLIE